MSKSIGNVINLDDLSRRGYSPEHVRFYLLYKHYRKKINLTEKSL